MINEKKTNRLFIGASVVAPWPEAFLSESVIKESNRHITICFLGQQENKDLDFFKSFPEPENVLSPAGVFLRYTGLPKNHARLIVIEGKMLSGVNLSCYQKKIFKWAIDNKIDFKKDKRPFYPHMTICRKDPDILKWENAKIRIPFYLDGIHLYQSFKDSEYEKLKTYQFVPVFKQIQHTADVAFLIRGDTLNCLYLNAQIALAFAYPDFVSFLDLEAKISTKEEIIIQLNAIVSQIDTEVGCPFKAVSFHGSFKQSEKGYIEWEMIVDV